MKSIKLSKKDQIKNLIKVLGKVKREESLENNPHGFSASYKVQKSKKVYNRNFKHKKSEY